MTKIIEANQLTQGDKVTLAAGLTYKYNNRENRTLTRARTVTVHSIAHYGSYSMMTWVSSGGYWNDVRLTESNLARITLKEKQ